MKKSTLLEKTFFLLAILFVIGLTSCEEEESENIQLEGIYVVNEGQFGNNNGSIALLDPETNKITNNYFQQQNGRSLGDIVQDLSFYKDKGFIVVNNSKKLEIVDKESFETIDVIGDLSYPRQFLAISDEKGYLTNGTSADGSNGYVFVIDLKNYSITDSIEVGKGPESMVKLNNKVFVTNAGGYGVDNKVSVIGTATDEVVKTIEVQDMPTDIVVDKNNNIWVYCKSAYSMDSYNYPNAQLYKINSENYSTTNYSIGAINVYGNYILTTGPDKENLYYVGGAGVYKMNINDASTPNDPIISKIPYGIDINPENGQVYCLTSSAQSKGYVFRYDSNHNLLDSVQVGYSPNAIVFE